MWNVAGRNEAGLAPDMFGSERHLYLEINEDFNLNLKGPTWLNEEQKEKIRKRVQVAEWTSGVNACRRDYHQQTWVLYEVDFGFLVNVNCLSKLVDNLGRPLEVIVSALNSDREKPAAS